MTGGPSSWPLHLRPIQLAPAPAAHLLHAHALLVAARRAAALLVARRTQRPALAVLVVQLRIHDLVHLPA
jgi:hypothetical protein